MAQTIDFNTGLLAREKALIKAQCPEIHKLKGLKDRKTAAQAEVTSLTSQITAQEAVVFDALHEVFAIAGATSLSDITVRGDWTNAELTLDSDGDPDDFIVNGA